MDRLNICDFWGCRMEISPEENEVDSHMRFCERHLEEFDNLVAVKNYKKLIDWWTRARGGVYNLINSQGVYQSHRLAKKNG